MQTGKQQGKDPFQLLLELLCSREPGKVLDLVPGRTPRLTVVATQEPARKDEDRHGASAAPRPERETGWGSPCQPKAHPPTARRVAAVVACARSPSQAESTLFNKGSLVLPAATAGNAGVSAQP